MAFSFFLYNTVLIVSTILVFLSDKVKGQRQKNAALLLAFFVVVIPAALRYGIGVDYFNYEKAFYGIANGVDIRFEFGYQMLNQAFIKMDLSFEYLVAFVSFLTYALFFKAYPKENKWFIHFVFMCTLYLYVYSNIRSGIIYGLMFLSVFHYIRYRKLLVFSMAVAVSVAFHKTAIIYFIIPVLFSKYPLKILSYKLVTELVLIVLVILLFYPNFLHKLLFNNPVTASLAIIDYSENEKWGAPPELGTGLGVLIRATPLVILVVFRSYFIKRYDGVKYLVPLALVTLFSIDLALAVTVAHRFEKYFFFTYFFIFLVFYNFFKGYLKLLFFSFFLLFYFYTFNAEIYSGVYRQAGIKKGIGIAPYMSVFDK